MNYCGLNLCDSSNGPGLRVSLFVSGCSIHCKECFNKNSWDFNYGKKFTEIEKDLILTGLKDSFIRGFSLLGGDPFEPEHKEVLMNLLKTIKSKYPAKDIWVWTGRLYKDIKDNELLDYIDVLVDGPFIEKFKDISLKYRGSSNQNIIYLNK